MRCAYAGSSPSLIRLSPKRPRTATGTLAHQTALRTKAGAGAEKTGGPDPARRVQCHAPFQPLFPQHHCALRSTCCKSCAQSLRSAALSHDAASGSSAPSSRDEPFDNYHAPIQHTHLLRKTKATRRVAIQNRNVYQPQDRPRTTCPPLAANDLREPTLQDGGARRWLLSSDGQTSNNSVGRSSGAL